MAVSDGEQPSLDLGKNNSTGPEEADSADDGPVELDSSQTGSTTGDDGGRYDCRTIYRNFRFEKVEGPEADDDPPTAPFRCGQWDCYCCGYHMRQNLIEEIGRICKARPSMSRLLTLTLDPDKAPDDQDEQHRYITERWNALRTRLKREVGDFSYIWVREEQENGLPHLHAIVSRYLPQSVVSAAWADLGGGEIVDIRKIERVDKAAHYVGKYLTKDALSGMPDGIRRYGSSADIELDVRGGDESEEDWRLLMEDHTVGGAGESLTRGVTGADFLEQRERGGPVRWPPPD